MAAQQVLDALSASTTEAGWHPDQVVFLPTKLLERGSTGPPPS